MPAAPSPERCAYLLDVLAHFVARSGAAPLLAPPIAAGAGAFPEPWRPTRGGVLAVLRRLAWHAGTGREIELVDERLGAPPTERKPATRIGLLAVSPKTLHFRLEFLGTDDIAGTLAHELGVAHAAVNRPAVADPYRDAELPHIEVDADRDLERGSIATVYLGLGVVAANAAYQQYSRGGACNGGYVPHEYDVLRAGYLPMSDLAYLLAVQAMLRGGDVPEGLHPPQRDEVAAWMAALAATELRDRLGVPRDARGVARAPVIAFTDIDLGEDAEAPRRTAFRWRTHRGGVGMIAGAVLGVGLATAVAVPNAAMLIVLSAAASGHVVGRGVRVPRCSACATVVGPDAKGCRACGAALRGDIAALSERLEAEEHLECPDDAAR